MVRLKNRYLLVNVLYPTIEKDQARSKIPDVVSFNQPTTNELTPQALLKGIRAEVATLFGDFGSGAVSESLAVKYLSPATSTFILRVSRTHYKILWAVLCLMTSVPVKNGRDCVFQVVRVSGTIKKAEEEAIRRARDIILEARKQAEQRGDLTLKSMFGSGHNITGTEADMAKDVMMVDGSDSEEEELGDDDD